MGTHHKGTRREVRALDAYIKLTRAADSVTARLSPLLDAAGLSTGQFGTLEVLYHLGPLAQGEIGRKLLRSGGNITMVVGNLEKRGLVARERDAQDRRVVTVTLTAEGRQLIEGIFPRHAARIADELSVLTDAEQDELARLCKKVGMGHGRAHGHGLDGRKA